MMVGVNCQLTQFRITLRKSFVDRMSSSGCSVGNSGWGGGHEYAA